ncbi:GNAT family N-acetyltransferase [Pseudoflavonifractor sp. 524-17]|uniref:GNAT family N-acetyltransferase n=1 Tax=Pseudoflavonifractor sp. 524-17 TaxID=2304577 RepID=UPI00137B21C4|nr:GNAT family N-acetyltransferase [Pseudoflavonifractor sp. 524-17]NCE63553.1 GNAT family N-acetyltransferase [Pseudoflavonifractor sp. 524-17]
MSIVIRHARPEDLDGICAVEQAGFPPAEGATRAAFAYRLSAFPQWFLVAEDGNAIIGLINGPETSAPFLCDRLYEPGGAEEGGPTLAILGLAVLPEYRRQGVAGQLIQSYLQLARAAGKQRVVLTCKEGLIPYYEKFGFVNRGVSASVHGGVVWYDMERAMDLVP